MPCKAISQKYVTASHTDELWAEIKAVLQLHDRLLHVYGNCLAAVQANARVRATAMWARSDSRAITTWVEGDSMPITTRVKGDAKRHSFGTTATQMSVFCIDSSWSGRTIQHYYGVVFPWLP